MIKNITLACLIIAQLSVPASLMKANEKILKQGAVYKFKTAPVDPYDIFRGRYVALRSEQMTAPFSDQENKKLDQRKRIGYAVIAVDQEGYAYVERLVAEKPEAGNYFKTTIGYSYSLPADGTGYFTFPVDRYYMNEKKAPQAEDVYRQYSTREKREAYMLVRVLDGEMVIERLMIGNEPVEDYLK